MATSGEADHSDVGGSDEEDAERRDRRHVEALLDLSEEESLRELDPCESHCYPGLEEAVRGWARVAPMSCILMSQRRERKPKYKDGDNQTPPSAEPTIPNAYGSASVAEHLTESPVCPHNTLKKSTPINQNAGFCGNAAVVTQQKDGSELPALNAVRKTTLDLLLKEKMLEEGTHRVTALQSRAAKPLKHSHRPPIKSPHLDPRRAGSNKAAEEDATEGDCCTCDKKSTARGTRADPVVDSELSTFSAARTSTYHTCQHNPHFLTAGSVSHPQRDQVPVAGGLQKDTSGPSVFAAVQKTTSALLKENVQGEALLGATPLQNRPAKPPKHSHVPIKNLEFLPPIKSPHLIHPELPVPPAALTSTYQTRQHNPNLFSAVSVSFPRRYQVPVSSKPDTVHRASYSVGKSLTHGLQTGSAAGSQARTQSMKTVSAAKL